MAGVLVVGEALVDVLVRDGREERRPGGSPANVAVGLARLGIPTTLITCFADDSDGALLAAHLAEVDVRRPAAVEATSTARAVLDDDGHATYDIDLCWDLTGVDDLPESQVLHIGSVAATLPPGCQQVHALTQEAHASGTTVTYDLNCRPAIMGSPDEARPVIERLVALSDIVKLSDEDAHWLYGDTDVFARLHDLGAPLVVMTLGADGCVASTGSARTVVPAVTGPIVDTVGAGDAFMAGLIARHDGDLREALEFASLVARRTCERAGADPPTLAELRR